MTKILVGLAIEQALLDRITDFQKVQHLSTKSEAIRVLILRGLDRG